VSVNSENEALVKSPTDTADTTALRACPYFRQMKVASYFRRSAVDEAIGYGYCHAYGTDYLRIASVQELNEYCKRDLHVCCPVYEWLRLKGRLSLVVSSRGSAGFDERSST